MQKKLYRLPPILLQNCPLLLTPFQDRAFYPKECAKPNVSKIRKVTMMMCRTTKMLLIATLIAAGTSAAPPTTFPRVLAASSTSPTKPDKCAEPPKCLQCNATLIQSKIERCTKIQPVRQRYPPWPADHLNAQPHPSAHRPITATHLNFFLLAFCRSCPLLFFSFMSCLDRTFYK